MFLGPYAFSHFINVCIFLYLDGLITGETNKLLTVMWTVSIVQLSINQIKLNFIVGNTESRK